MAPTVEGNVRATARVQVRPYIWNDLGPLARREGSALVRYEKGDVILLSAKEAYRLRGSLTTEGGLMIPKSLFSPDEHPTVEQPKPSTPHNRPGAIVRGGATLRAEKRSEVIEEEIVDEADEARGGAKVEAKAAVKVEAKGEVDDDVRPRGRTSTATRATAGGAA